MKKDRLEAVLFSFALVFYQKGNAMPEDGEDSDERDERFAGTKSLMDSRRVLKNT